jgi:glutamate synthase domain-containing protein 1
MTDNLLYIPPLPKLRTKEQTQQSFPRSIPRPVEQKQVEEDTKKPDYYDVVIVQGENPDTIIEWCKDKNIFVFEDVRLNYIRVCMTSEQQKILKQFSTVEKINKFVPPRVCST